MPSPYTEKIYPNLTSIYGQSKYLGEQLLLNKTTKYASILRLSWVFSHHKGCNFLLNLLNNIIKTETISVTTDLLDSPTSALHVAEVIERLSLKMISKKRYGEIFHYCHAMRTPYSAFVSYVIESSKQLQLISSNVNCRPILSKYYGCKVRRSLNNTMDTNKLRNLIGTLPTGWEKTINQTLLALTKNISFNSEKSLYTL